MSKVCFLRLGDRFRLSSLDSVYEFLGNEADDKGAIQKSKIRRILVYKNSRWEVDRQSSEENCNPCEMATRTAIEVL